MSNFFDQFDKAESTSSNFFDQFDAPAAPAPKTGLVRSAADIALSAGQGATGAFKAITDLAGAENVVSSGLDDAGKYLQTLKSPGSKATLENSQARVDAAEKTGSTWEEAKAYMGMLYDQPAEMLAQGVGSFATMGFGKAAQALKLATAAKAAGVSKASFIANPANSKAIQEVADFGFRANIGIGAGMGVGAVKGSQYEQTFKNAKAQGMGDEEAAALATKAQEYGGAGTGQQLLGAGLGAVASATGPIERVIMGKGAREAGQGMMMGVGKGFGTEFATEGAQGAQERYAGNVAAIDAGVLAPDQSMRGVVGQGLMEGSIGGVVGGLTGVFDTRPKATPKDILDAPDIDSALKAAQDALIKPAALNVPPVVVPNNTISSIAPSLTGTTAAQLLATPDNPFMQAALTGRNDREQDALGDATVGDMRAEMDDIYKSQRQFGRDTSVPDLPLPSDIMRPNGVPFTNEKMASIVAKRTPNAEVVAVAGGFVVRLPQESVNVSPSPGVSNIPATAAEGRGTEPTSGLAAGLGNGVPDRPTVDAGGVRNQSAGADVSPANGINDAAIATLPKDLAGAKPRYSYGPKQFDLSFASDFDRAAYIAAQDKPSKRDADYLKFAMDSQGMTEADVRAHGKAVRATIKAQAKNAQPGVLQVPSIPRSNVKNTPPAAGTAQAQTPSVQTPEAGKADETGAAAAGAEAGSGGVQAAGVDIKSGPANGDARNSGAMKELEGFKPGDVVDVPSRTIGRSTIKQVYNRELAGLGAVPMADIVNAAGKTLTVNISELVAADTVQAGATGFVIPKVKANAAAPVAKPPAKKGLGEQLAELNAELERQGNVQNANTRAQRDSIRKQIAAEDFPEILKAVDDNIDVAEELNSAFTYAGDEPKAKTIERVLKKRGLTPEYQARWTKRLMDGQQDKPTDAQATGDFGPILTQFKGDAQGAIKALTELQDGEAVAALNHPEVGDIDLVWGKSPSDKQEGYGLAKISMKHPEVLKDLQGFLNGLHKDQKNSGANRIRLVNDAGDAVVSLDWKNEQKVWLLTAYKKGAEVSTTMDTADNGTKDDTARLSPDPTVSVAKPGQNGKPDALTEQEKAAKAKMLGAAAKLAELLSKNTRLNITPEQEQKMLPIVIELFDGAMELGYVKFKQAARYVREFLANAIDQDAADSIPMDTLQGAYIATSRRHKDKAITPKGEVISVESFEELNESVAAVEQTPEKVEKAPQNQTLTQSLAAAIEAGNMPKDNPALKKLVEAFDGKPADPARMKQAQEELETAIVMTARKVVAKNEGDRSTYDMLLRLYESQPNLNIRTSTSIANQAYSTPAPLAFLASRLAGITSNSVVHEPTGGTGMLLIGADPQKAIVNELNDLRISALKVQGFTPTQKDAATQLLVPEGAQPDAVVTNPPFGSVKDGEGKPVKVKVDGYNIGQIDHLIAARALQAMKPDGKATLILGANKVAGGLSTDDRIFFNWLYSHYNVVGHFEVEGDLYTRQGASWPVRVITINGRQASKQISPLAGTIQRAENWDQVYEQFTESLKGASTRPATDSAGVRTSAIAPSPAPAGGRRPQSGTNGAANVTGTPAGNAPDLTVRTPPQLGGSRDEQRLNAQSDGQPPDTGGTAGADANPAGSNRPGQRAGATALTSEAAGNKFQSPYVPRSSRKDEGVLIPSNMAQPTQDALSTLEDAVGDIDEFARDQLGYETVDALHDALMGLQVDSVATAIYQIQRGKAVVIADQTGIGKGRQAAAMIRWAIKSGYTPVFVSVKPALFTDMYGDLADIGSNNVRPFIMNSKESIAGADGAKLYANKPSAHRRNLEQIEATGELPNESNAVFMTYSQINSANIQRRALMTLAPNAIFILDESHNAAGESATGKFVIGALELAKGVTYLSATYAKRPDNMPLYFKTDIGAAAADTEGLSVAMAAGGLPLQTVVSNNLVKAGQMFRRERSYDGVEIKSIYDTPNRQKHERMSDEATKALRAIVEADSAFHEGYVKQLNEELAAQGESVKDSAGNQATAGVQHTEFSSVVHNFIKQMLLGLKAESAADSAIASLKRGEKPIIAVENTMGSFLKEYAAANNIAQGNELGTYDYRTVLSRALARSRVVVVKDAQGNETKRPVSLSELDARTRSIYEASQDIINGVTLDIPASPIDAIRDKVIKAGFTVAEITGRDLSVDYTDPNKPVLAAIDLLEQKDKVNTTRQFNAGKLDVLILNVAGSTGISLHASEKFADQRQRHMIVAQAAGDINVFMQMLGRVHRTGQVALPKYSILSVDLPTEKRPTAVLSVKMKSLNANTSSNTESATSVQTADILNKYGDQIVTEYLREDYRLAVALGVQDLVGGDKIEDDIARKATGRLALQPIEVQQAFYNDVEAQYASLIEYLNKTNQNDLEPRTFDFDAQETRQEILFEGPDKSTPFGEDAIYGEYSIKAQGIPMKPEEIQAAMNASLEGKSASVHVNQMIDGLLDTWAKQMNAERAKHGLVPGRFDAEKYQSFMESLYGKDGAVFWVDRAKAQVAKGENIEDMTKERLENTAGTAGAMEFMRDHAIGKTFRVDINGDPYNAVVTNIRNTHKETGNPFSMSKIQLTVAVNGALRSLSVPATQFRKIEVSSISGGYGISQLFREQPPNQRETAKIVTGNLLAAYGEISGARGTIISFTKQDGTNEQGILLPKLFDFSKNTRGDFRLPDGAGALRFLQTSDNRDIGRFGIMSRDGNVRVLPAGQGVRVQVPKSRAKGGKFFLDKALIAAAGDFVSSGNFMTATVYEPAGAIGVLDLLMKKQALYALPSMAEEAKAMTKPAGPNDTNVVFSQGLLSQPSQGPKPTFKEIQRLVDRVQNVAKNVIPITVIGNPGQIAGVKVPVGAKPTGAVINGQIYLFADNIKSTGDAFTTLFHEIFHLGLQKVIPAEDYAMLLRKFASNLMVRRFVQTWKASPEGIEKAASMPSAAYEALAAEEALAMVSEELSTNNGIGTNKLPGLVKTFLSWLAKVADSIGFPADFGDWMRGLTRNDAEKFASDMVRAVMGGDKSLGRKRAKYGTELVEMTAQSRLLAGSAADQTNTPDIRFSQSLAGSVATPNDPRAYWQIAKDAVAEFSDTPGKISWWHKTVGTPYSLAQKSPQFKAVFDRVQDFINDVSVFATQAADQAPTLLPKLESWRDMTKTAISAQDTKAIAAPVFEGTLLWGRDENGKPIKMADKVAAADKLSAPEKAQEMLRAGLIQERVLKMWQGQSLEQYEAAVNTSYAANVLKEGVVWSEGELKSLFKLNERQIALYKEFRSATDTSLTQLAITDMLRFAGEDSDPVRADMIAMGDVDAAAVLLRDHLLDMAEQDAERNDLLINTANQIMDKADRARDLMNRGYAPLSRFGQYTVDVVSETGERLYFSMFEGRLEAARRAEQMQRTYPQATITRGTVSQEEYKLFAGVSPETLELFGGMLGLEGNSGAAKDQAFQAYIKLAKSNRSSMKRLLERKGIAGFSEDAGRVLAGFVYSNARQASRNLHMGEIDQKASEVDKGQGELKDQAVRLANYIKNPVEEAQALRGLLFAQYLGGSIASALVNMTQPFAVTMPYLSQFGGVAKAGKRMAQAVRDAAKDKTGDAALDAAMKKAADEGIVAPQEVHQLMAQAAGKGSLKAGDGTRAGDAAAMANNALTKLSLVWGKPFSTAELFNRRTTFIAAYRTAVDEGMADPAAFAKQAINETQFVYNKGNRPAWARGAIGTTLFTFKTYSISYLELMHRMATTGEPGSPERAAGRRAVLFAMGMVLLLSGAGGLPFAEDAEDVVDGIAQRLGYNWSSKQKRKQLLEDAFGKALGGFLNKGVTGIPGAPIDVSGRLGLQNLIPGTGIFQKKTDFGRDATELLGPVGDLVSRGLKSVDLVTQGKPIESAMMASPVAARNIQKALDMATSGKYKDERGYKVMDVDGFDALAKSIGFQPGDVAQVQASDRAVQQMVALTRLRESEISAKWAAAVAERDPAGQQEARAQVQDWNEKNPSTPIKIRMGDILKRAKNMNMDRSERIAKAAPKEIRATVRRELAGTE